MAVHTDAVSGTTSSHRPGLLLAEDDHTLSSVLAGALDARGFEVLVAHDGARALELAEARTPGYALVDLRLPDMSGLKLLETLKAMDYRMTVVMLTGYGSIATAVEAMKLGATSYLPKPASIDQIVAALERREASVNEPAPAQPLSVDRLEWEHIQCVLTSVDGNVSAAARALNMHRRTLQRKLSKYPPRK